MRCKNQYYYQLTKGYNLHPSANHNIPCSLEVLSSYNIMYNLNTLSQLHGHSSHNFWAPYLWTCFYTYNIIIYITIFFSPSPCLVPTKFSKQRIIHSESSSHLCTISRLGESNSTKIHKA